MKRVYVFLILTILLVSSLAFVFADSSCSSDSDCKVNICAANSCVNANYTTPNETGCAFPPSMRADYCKCENNVCVGYKNGQGNGNQTQNQTQEQNRTQNKTEKANLTFVPWQKRNESECLEGCKCVGAVMSCPTADGKIMTIQAGRSGNIITITIVKNGNESADTELEIETENETELEGNQTRNRTRLRAKLSDGSKKEVKIMPDTASERALERLRLKVCNESNNCTIVLKEVPVGSNKTVAYELQVQRHMRILALFRAKAQVKAQVSAENGEIIGVKKPWWAFLATEPEE